MVEFLNRYIGLQIENGYGSAGTTTTYGEVDSESLQHKFELLTRNDMSHHMATKSVVGTSYSEGGMDLAIQCDNFFGKLLYGCWPHQLTPTGTGPYTHVMLEPTLVGHTYPSFKITVGREEKQHTYTGMAIDTLSLSANVGEYTMASASFVGKAESATGALISTESITFSGDALDALHFADGTVTFNDGTAVDSEVATGKVKSFSLDISMNRDTDNAYAIGNSTYTSIPAAQRREITGTIEFNQVVYTAATGTDEPTYDLLIGANGEEYSSTTSLPALSLKFTDEAGADYFEIELYHLRFEAPEANVSGRDTNTMSLNFVALGQQGNTRTFTATTGGNTTLTVDAANWDKVKIGDILNSAGISAGTYVIAKPSGTTLTISANASTTASETITIMPNYTSSAVTLKGDNLNSAIYAHDA